VPQNGGVIRGTIVLLGMEEIIYNSAWIPD